VLANNRRMTDDHATDAQKKKEEAAKRLQEALLRKQNRPQKAQDQHAQPKPGGSGAYAPKLFRRGPRGG
jgi:hypothetical protein